MSLLRDFVDQTRMSPNRRVQDVYVKRQPQQSTASAWPFGVPKCSRSSLVSNRGAVYKSNLANQNKYARSSNNGYQRGNKKRRMQNRQDGGSRNERDRYGERESASRPVFPPHFDSRPVFPPHFDSNRVFDYRAPAVSLFKVIDTASHHRPQFKKSFLTAPKQFRFKMAEKTKLFISARTQKSYRNETPMNADAILGKPRNNRWKQNSGQLPSMAIKIEQEDPKATLQFMSSATNRTGLMLFPTVVKEEPPLSPL